MWVCALCGWLADVQFSPRRLLILKHREYEHFGRSPKQKQRKSIVRQDYTLNATQSENTNFLCSNLFILQQSFLRWRLSVDDRRWRRQWQRHWHVNVTQFLFCVRCFFFILCFSINKSIYGVWYQFNAQFFFFRSIENFLLAFENVMLQMLASSHVTDESQTPAEICSSVERRGNIAKWSSQL